MTERTMAQMGKALVELHEDIADVGKRIRKMELSLQYAERQLTTFSEYPWHDDARGYWLSVITRDVAILRRYRLEEAALLDIWFGEEFQP